jgi:dolichol-phosphate mannosyltransferase
MLPHSGEPMSADRLTFSPTPATAASGPVSLLSIVIPAHNEEGCIESTVRDLHTKLAAEDIRHEILVVNDNSSDRTEDILIELEREIPELRHVNNRPPHGFGFAVRCGLAEFTGDAVAVYMADASDRPEDLVAFYRTMEREGVDCVFGTRFHKDGKTVDYPQFKLVINRMANLFIQMMIGIRYNDTTNAFKLYRRHVIEGLQPLLSHHFNLTVELPLKSIVRGYTYAIVPNWWINRKTGESKLKIKEMGSRYLFIVLYCLIEKRLSRGDYHVETQARQEAARAAKAAAAASSEAS